MSNVRRPSSRTRYSRTAYLSTLQVRTVSFDEGAAFQLHAAPAEWPPGPPPLDPQVPRYALGNNTVHTPCISPQSLSTSQHMHFLDYLLSKHGEKDEIDMDLPVDNMA